MQRDNHDGTKSRKVKTLSVKADYSALVPKNKKVQCHNELLLSRPGGHGKIIQATSLLSYILLLFWFK